MTFLESWHLPPRRVVLWHAFSALPLAVVVGLGAFLSYHYHALSAQSREHVDNGYEVLVRINALFLSVEDADVAQRDYLITGDEARLRPFTAALQSASSSLEQLHQLTLDNPAQQNRLARLGKAIAVKLEELGQTIALRRSQGFDAARAVVARAEGNPSMDAVRAEATAIFAAEYQLLQQRQKVERSREQDILRIGIFIAAISVVLRFFIAWFLARLRKKGKSSSGDATT